MTARRAKRTIGICDIVEYIHLLQVRAPSFVGEAGAEPLRPVSFDYRSAQLQNSWNDSVRLQLKRGIENASAPQRIMRTLRDVAGRDRNGAPGIGKDARRGVDGAALIV